MKITVLLGGASSERNVSLASGLRIAQALRAGGHRVTCVDPATGVLDDATEQRLLASGVGAAPPSPEELARLAIRPTFAEGREVRDADVVFLARHGGQGEDGTIQALLDMAGVRYTGSGPMSSGIAMDKDVSKILFRAAQVPTADWRMAPRQADARFAADVIAALGLPVIVKPSKQGSTVGLSIVKQRDELLPAVAEAFRHDDEVMVERFVPGRELTVGILGDVALPVVEIIPRHEIYDYECKYTAGMAVEEVPARLTPAETTRVQEAARRAFTALKLRGYARIDFRMSSEDGEFYCLEANTLPGMTELSLIPQAAAAAGIDFGALCVRIVELAQPVGANGGAGGMQDTAGAMGGR